MDLWPDAPKPGLYKGVAWETYCRWDAINHSRLRHFRRTPAHARVAMLEDREESAAQRLGTAAHSAILEPERFELLYGIMPEIDRPRTNKGKAEKAALLSEAADAGRNLITEAEYRKAEAMRDSVWSNQVAAELLRSGPREVSVSWRDKETGVPCKARYDAMGAIGGWPCIGDVKSSKNAEPRSFSRDLYTFDYHHQAGFYVDGADTLKPYPRKYVLIVVENVEPFCTALYEVDEEAIELGRQAYRKHLRTYLECIQSGQWPGYDPGLGYISVPTWALKFHGEEA